MGIGSAADLHENIMMPIILHVVLQKTAALYHHFILKTGVSRRMTWPNRVRRRRVL